MIKVYIETGGHAECVATIADEWTYMALLPAFEKMAHEQGGILTESVVDDTPPKPITEVYLVMCSDSDANAWEIDSAPTILHVCIDEQRAKDIAHELQLTHPDSNWEYYVTTKTIEL